jgi:nucleoside-diphosphate-sugar epimerase
MILVAGGDGFLGRPYCDLLHQKGAPVLSLDVHPAGPSTYPTITSDIRDREALEAVFEQFSIHTVVNLAAILVSASKVDPISSFQVNVEGAFNLLDLCQKYAVSRFVFGSSYSALGEPPKGGQPIDERVPPQPADFYGHTKAFVERMGTAFSRCGEFDFISARMPMIVGPGEGTATSAWRVEMFNKLASKGEVFFNYAPDEVLPLAHYEDVAEAIASLTLAEELEFNLYHLPYENWRVGELGRLLQEFNPDLKIAFGERRMDNSPTELSWKRIQTEFDIQPPSLRARLKQELKRSS